MADEPIMCAHGGRGRTHPWEPGEHCPVTPVPAAVLDSRFRDQLAEAEMTEEQARYYGAGYVAGLAEVEARVQAAANQRAAEELEAAARGVMAGATEVRGLPGAVRQALTIAATTISVRAAALAQPAPGTRPATEEARR